MARILVVDDVPDNVRLLCYELADQEHEVLTALSGREALGVASAECPDLILLDVMMPDMDGIEVCRRLKEDARTRTIPVILVTAKGLDENVVSGLDAGADDYISKPYNSQVLAARVRSALRVKESYEAVTRTNELLREEIAVRRRAEEQMRKSEAKFRALYDYSGDAMILLDEDGFFSCNDSALRMFRYESRDELCSKHPAQLSPPTQPDGSDSLHLANERIAAATQDGSSRFEWLHRRSDGTDFPAEVLLGPMDLDGKRVLQAVVRDITERKRAETELRESEDRLGRIASAAQDAIIMIDNHGDVTFWNDAAEKIFGYSRQEVLGKNAHELLMPPSHLEKHRQCFPKFQQTGEGAAVGKTVQLEALRKNGEQFPIEMSLSSLEIAGQWHAIGIARDVSERKQIEDSLRNAHAELEQIFNAAPPMAVLALDRTILRVNDKCAEFFGVEKDEIVGKKYHDTLAGSSCGTPDCCLEPVEPEMSFEEEQIKYLPDGRKVPCIVKSYPYRDGLGEIIGRVHTMTDVSQLKEAEHALRESERRYRTLYESSRDAIMTLTAEEGFLSGNPATVELFGCKDEKDFTSYTPADLSPEVQPDGMPSSVKAQQMMALALDNGSHFFEWKHKRVGGTEFDATVLLTRMELDGRQMLQATVRDITELKQKQAQVQRLNRELVETSRRAGMAEVATGVLHNVGNVLNSVNVSANVVVEKLRGRRITGVSKVAALLDEHADHLTDFLVADVRGKQLPAYLKNLAEHLSSERDVQLQELADLLRNIEHIKEIVSMQQEHSRVSGVTELVNLDEIIDGAFKLHDASFVRHNVEIVREYEDVPPLTIDKHHLLQILVNLISNAKHALKESMSEHKRLTLRIGPVGEQRVRVEVCDNGLGIQQENMAKIFEHGFTTKKEGYGFGLHSSALAATQIGGSLTAYSDGPGRGALFCLELPLNVEEEALCTA